MAAFRKSGQRWRAEIYKNGVRVSARFDTKSEAKRWANAKEKEIAASVERGQVVVAKRTKPSTPSLIALLQKEDVLKKSAPLKQLCGIYFLIEGDDIVYVGQSTDVISRLASHQSSAKQFSSYSYISCERANLTGLERAYIAKFKPKYNIAGNPLQTNGDI